MLAANQARLRLRAIDPVQLAGGPQFIETIEWRASAADLARTFNWFRISGGPAAMRILGVNLGVNRDDASRFARVGYKGGSEAGVISLNLVAETRDGRWYAVTAIWNDPRAAVDTVAFEAILSRAIAFIPE